jgi:hypothetical protein
MKLRPAGEPCSPRLRPGRHASRTHRVARSVVGPQGIGNRWFSVGTSGRCRHATIPVTGHSRPEPGEMKQRRGGFESHLTAAAGQRPLLTRQASPRTGLTLPPAEPVPSQPGPSHVHPHRPCPGRALSIGRQRSFTDNKGRCVSPPSCRTAPYGAVRGSFPSSRWAALGPRTTGTLRTTPRSHSHRLSSSASLLGRPPQATTTRRFALTRKRSKVLNRQAAQLVPWQAMTQQQQQ